MKPVSEWGLTRRERETFQAVIDEGCNKGAARVMGISVRTVEAHLLSGLAKTDAGYGYPARIRALIAFDRATRTEGGAV